MSTTPPLGAPAIPAARIADARAAFFRQALAQPAAPAAAPVAPAQPFQPASIAAPTASASPATPERLPRPGSIIDIRV